MAATTSARKSHINGRSQRVKRRRRNSRNLAPTACNASPSGQYCESTNTSVRRPTRTVHVGDVPVGSKHPIVEQTMVTADTRDVDATVDEIMRCSDAGAKMVRATVQGVKEAEACGPIKDKLLKHGYTVPLVADIHFAPKIALKVADAFEKVRINPGNFFDGAKKFEEKVYDTPEEYAEELEQIEERFTPLVEKCKRLNRAMRIGTNHGSLSARVLSVYGDTPAGMVESAFEFARICRKHDYNNFLFSMKASNPLVMVQAYRLLSHEMYKGGEDWAYPLHLGVTEAGEGEDGRIKSAIGIGALLMDGLGDTIRVSLTENPELELEPCRNLARLGEQATSRELASKEEFTEKHRHYDSFKKRAGELPAQREGDEIDFRTVLHRDGSVISSVTLDDLARPETCFSKLGCRLSVGIPIKDLASSDSIFLNDLPDEADSDRRRAIRRLQDSGVGVIAPIASLHKRPLENAIAAVPCRQMTSSPMLLPDGVARTVVTLDGNETREEISQLKSTDAIMLLFNIHNDLSRIHESRRLADIIIDEGINLPIIHHITFDDSATRDDLVIQAGTYGGAMLTDGLGDGVLLDAPDFDLEFLRTTSFNLLQGSRMRNTKTEFVSCPSCGRTLFDLQEVTAQIQRKTGHLPGVSIAVMGCIVNGPGEMADADFGYVGGAPGKIDLYVGKEVVQRGIPMEDAPDALIDLIKAHDRWIEPPEDEHADVGVDANASEKAVAA